MSLTPAAWLEIPDGHPFGLAALPYCSFETDRGRVRVGARIGDRVLDLTRLFGAEPFPGEILAGGTLDALLASDLATWRALRRLVWERLVDPAYRAEAEPHLHHLADVHLRLPFTVADYVDFYSSAHHAARVGEIFRPDAPALPRQWHHLPIGYHGRAGTVVVSGTDVVRPAGQRLDSDGTVVVGPTRKLDFEAEVAFVLGAPTQPGGPVPQAEARDHIFGVCLLNDWSARDIQAWEYVPLGPFLGKSFATSLSAWVLPMDALDAARVAPPPREVPLAPYLDDTGSGGSNPRDEPWGLDLRLEVLVDGRVVSRPPFRSTYWTAAQQLAHLTSNGASVRAGDLFASGTVSGPADDERGCLLELTWDGRDGDYLADDAVVTITATAPGPAGTTVGLGEVTARIRPPSSLAE